MTDTGSMQPSPEAIAWSQRAEAWAQRSEDGDGDSDRWSEVAANGRPTLPPDGVGWRTETAEWRSTEQTARWRQTTEWRSASGTHGWRSTTEAWQTGSGAENFRPPVDPPVREQLAISGTAWPTPESAGAAEGPAGSWQRFTDPVPPWQQPGADTGPGAERRVPRPLPGVPPPWQQPVEPGESAGTGATAYREGPLSSVPGGWSRRGESAPGGIRGAGTGDGGGSTPEPGRHWSPAGTRSGSRDSDAGTDWREPAGGPGIASGPADHSGETAGGTAGRRAVGADGDTGWHTAPSSSAWREGSGAAAVRPGESPSWPDFGSGTPGGQQAGSTTRGGQQTGSATPSWGVAAAQEASSWQASPDASSWQAASATPDRQQAAEETPSWRSAAVTPDRQHSVVEAPSWSESAVPVGGQPAIPSWQQPASAVPSWQQPASDVPGWQSAEQTPSWQQPMGAGSTPTTDVTSGSRSVAAYGSVDDGTHLVRDDDRARWGQEVDRGRQVGRRRAPEAGIRTSGGTGWSTGSDADNWAGHTDTGSISVFPEQAGTESQTWRGNDAPTAWRRADQSDFDDRTTRRPEMETGQPADEPDWRSRSEEPDWRSGLTEPDWRSRSDESDWRSGLTEPDWRSRSEEPNSGGWSRGEGEGEGRRRELNGWQDSDTGSWRREIKTASAADPWAGSADGTGVVPEAWQPSVTDTGRWRSEPRERPYNPNRVGRRRAAEPDTGLSSGSVDPAVWHRPSGEQPEAAHWPVEDVPLPDDAVAEFGPPVSRQADDQAAQGSASYRGSDTGDWRRDLAIANGSNLAEGQSGRFGTQDFVPFRPSGSAAVPVPAPTSPPVADDREQLLVGNSTVARRQDPPDTQWPPRRASGSYERRTVRSLAAAPDRPAGRSLEPDEDEIEENTGGPLAAVGYTVIWYGVPVVLFVLYMLVLSGSQQAQALGTLTGAAPQFGLSLVLSMLVAVGLRRASSSWKAASVGLAAAVMGGGLATVLSSAITGNSLG